MIWRLWSFSLFLVVNGVYARGKYQPRELTLLDTICNCKHRATDNVTRPEAVLNSTTFVIKVVEEVCFTRQLSASLNRST
ncbi:hypothetical protein G7K_0612-t1 [Saitoella complicata NRRL Y-17804]|uniref:Secreted protein n=1 Tax=Saitoella complicata (strain BCRC 22490 / CBS 7301 / JCM 7358 / NBRC 10748 / NRRL Y-17804) TaxID=698492 RepID=A0A0E9N9K6_SAICN|nr:hypothetical protein G7K_0612-t1 [Saitoella complicata NRRL Y-17804]